MRMLLVIAVLLVVGVVGLGFYLGWFSISTSRDAEHGKTGVELNIDQGKMKADAERAREKINNAVKQGKDQSDGK